MFHERTWPLSSTSRTASDTCSSARAAFAPRSARTRASSSRAYRRRIRSGTLKSSVPAIASAKKPATASVPTAPANVRRWLARAIWKERSMSASIADDVALNRSKSFCPLRASDDARA